MKSIPLWAETMSLACVLFSNDDRAARMLLSGARYFNAYEDASVPGGVRYGGAANPSRKEADAVASAFCAGNGLRRLYVLRVTGKGAAPAVVVPKFPRVMPPLGDMVSA